MELKASPPDSQESASILYYEPDYVIHTISSCFPDIHYNIILSSTSRFS
jgi:hypothetical protein